MSQVVKSIVLIDTSRLIREVQVRPPLWNTRIVSGKETVERLWGEVADALGTTEKDAKQKWKNLKDTFRKEMKKAVECGPTYTPMWPHYQRLSFLTEILLKSKRIWYSSDDVLFSNVLHREARFDSEDSNTENQTIGDSEVRVSPKRRRETEEVKVDIKIEPDDDVSGRQEVSRDTGVSHREGFAPTASHPMNTWECYGMDEDYHFFMSLMPHMKAFEPLQKLQVRNRIHDVIIREMSTESRNDGATSSTEPAQ